MSYCSKILIVASLDSLWKQIGGWLEEADYTVLYAINGRSAFDLYNKQNPHIIVVDFALPNHDGLQICQQIKNQSPAIAPLIYLAVTRIDKSIATENLDDFLLMPLAKKEFLLKMDIANRLILAECERNLLLDVASSLQNAPVNASLLPEILQELQKMFIADSIALTTIDKITDEIHIIGAYGSLAQLAGLRILKSELWIEFMQNSQESILIESIKVWAEKLDLYLGDSNLEPTNLMAAVPLRNEETVFGILWVGSTQPVEPSFKRFLTAMASMLTTVLHQEVLMQEAQNYHVELEKRVTERTQELSVAYERLQELNQMKSNFVSNVSHELRLPISNLMLYLELLQKGHSEKRAIYEAQLMQNTERLNILVDNLLNLSSLEAKMDKTPMFPVDMNEVINEAISISSSIILASSVQVHFEPFPDLPSVVGRHKELVQVITNLLDNAVRYSEQGQILIETLWQNEDQTVTCSIKDNGIGILPEDMPKIFDRFYRGQESMRRQISGSGLGLSIVREIVEQHNGRIAVTSVPGEGATFTLSLPV